MKMKGSISIWDAERTGLDGIDLSDKVKEPLVENVGF